MTIMVITMKSNVVNLFENIFAPQIDQIINQSCEALKMILKQQMNRVSKIKFLITSLQMR